MFVNLLEIPSREEEEAEAYEVIKEVKRESLKSGENISEGVKKSEKAKKKKLKVREKKQLKGISVVWQVI